METNLRVFLIGEYNTIISLDDVLKNLPPGFDLFYSRHRFGLVTRLNISRDFVRIRIQFQNKWFMLIFKERKQQTIKDNPEIHMRRTNFGNLDCNPNYLGYYLTDTIWINNNYSGDLTRSEARSIFLNY